MTNLTGKIALVTCASRDIARGLAGVGATIAVGYHTGESEAQETVAWIVAQGGKAEILGAQTSGVIGPTTPPARPA